MAARLGASAPQLTFAPLGPGDTVPGKRRRIRGILGLSAGGEDDPAIGRQPDDRQEEWQQQRHPDECLTATCAET